MYDYLIVGSGLYGATFAHIAKSKGKRCLVIDRRHSVGGNVQSALLSGIDVHLYGAHIFHTSNEKVWKFVSGLVPFNRYTNSPIARYKNELYNLPFNMNTFCQMWGCKRPDDAELKLREQRDSVWGELLKAGVKEPRNLEEQALALVGRDIYEKLIKGYTEKQWGRPCSELPASIIKRIPLRLVFDNNYFDDTWQGIPIGGFNKLIHALLSGIECRTFTDFFKDRPYLESRARKIVFTGAIDEFYGYRFGHLQYRTVRFENEILDTPNWQGNAVVNYTEREVPFTRVIEHKHFAYFGQAVYDNPMTVISREYPVEWHPGLEPYYPINDSRNQKLYEKYKALADAEPNVIFGGRLGEYKYYNMDEVIASAMDKARSVIGE